MPKYDIVWLDFKIFSEKQKRKAHMNKVKGHLNNNSVLFSHLRVCRWSMEICYNRLDVKERTLWLPEKCVRI